MPPAGRRPLVRGKRWRPHDRSSCRTAQGRVGGNRHGWRAVFAAFRGRGRTLSRDREPLVPHRDKTVVLNTLPGTFYKTHPSSLAMLARRFMRQRLVHIERVDRDENSGHPVTALLTGARDGREDRGARANV